MTTEGTFGTGYVILTIALIVFTIIVVALMIVFSMRKPQTIANASVPAQSGNSAASQLRTGALSSGMLGLGPLGAPKVVGSGGGATTTRSLRSLRDAYLSTRAPDGTIKFVDLTAGVLVTTTDPTVSYNYDPHAEHLIAIRGSESHQIKFGDDDRIRMYDASNGHHSVYLTNYKDEMLSYSITDGLIKFGSDSEFLPIQVTPLRARNR